MPKPTRMSFTAGGHTTSYLEAGPPDGPLLIFVHGWPALAATWRHQLDHFAGLGFRVVAPDLRGYGHSTVYPDPDAYRQELVVGDLLALHDRLGAAPAVWIGHDWGSPTVWNIAAHHPERCRAVATLAVPFGSLEHGLPALLDSVDRRRYPRETFPYGQFDYMVYYLTAAERAAAVLDAAPANTVKVMYRAGDPAVHTGPARTASISTQGGWFGGADAAPDVPLDTAVLSVDDHAELTESLARNGFLGTIGYYRNHDANAAYAGSAQAGGRLSLPVLFIGADYDPIADLTSPLMLVPMRSSCADLTEHTVAAGHWLYLEAADRVNRHLADWLHARDLGPHR